MPKTMARRTSHLPSTRKISGLPPNLHGRSQNVVGVASKLLHIAAGGLQGGFFLLRWQAFEKQTRLKIATQLTAPLTSLNEF
jgi:hypothetical protein